VTRHKSQISKLTGKISNQAQLDPCQAPSIFWRGKIFEPKHPSAQIVVMLLLLLMMMMMTIADQEMLETQRRAAV
jgi:hypothetical protein